jgi:hypothetical protein
MSFDFLKDILPSLITLIIAIGTASLGLRSWRKQLIEKEKREFAKEFLKKLYRLIDIIKDIRHIVSYNNEGLTRKRSDDESDFISKKLDSAFIPIERYIFHKPAIDEFRVLKYEYFILFNKEDERLFLEIEKIFIRI